MRAQSETKRKNYKSNISYKKKSDITIKTGGLLRSSRYTARFASNNPSRRNRGKLRSKKIKKLSVDSCDAIWSREELMGSNIGLEESEDPLRDTQRLENVSLTKKKNIISSSEEGDYYVKPKPCRNIFRAKKAKKRNLVRYRYKKKDPETVWR